MHSALNSQHFLPFPAVFFFTGWLAFTDFLVAFTTFLAGAAFFFGLGGAALAWAFWAAFRSSRF